MNRPLIGITCDLTRPKNANGTIDLDGPARMAAAVAYARAVNNAGGTPMVLAPLVELAPEYLRRCNGFVFTGGDDPSMEPFGCPTHPKAKPMDPMRQAFETALLQALESDRSKPVLGVCLGMQMMALVAGGGLNQHLPDDCPTADLHHPDARGTDSPRMADRTHQIVLDSACGADWAALLCHGATAGASAETPCGTVASYHHQAVSDPGRLRVVARSPDGVIEAIGSASPNTVGSAWRLGVQWHPERTADERLGMGLFRALVKAAGKLR